MDAVAAGRPTTDHRPRLRLLLVLLPAPVVTAVLVVVAQGVASEWFSVAPDVSGAWELGSVLWGVSPALGLAGLVLACAERRRARPALLVGGGLLLVATALMLWLSVAGGGSTAALGLLFAPVYGWLVVALTALAALVSVRTGRRAAPPGPASR